MGESNTNIENIDLPEIEEKTKQNVVLDELSKCSGGIAEVKESVKYLQDLFVRRLNDDKQKAEMIKHLEGLSSYAFIEPFISELILVLDRIESVDDDFADSLGDEIYGILHRRGVDKIVVTDEFNPSLHKAVRVDDTVEVDTAKVTQVVRNGYTFSGKVIRPAEVIVAIHKSK